MQEREPQIVVGLGTGRCGSLSLARLLGQQEGCEVQHERYPTLSWYGDWNPVRNLQPMAPCSVWGDVGMYYLPYVNQIRDDVPGVRFICMKRDKRATCDSFQRLMPKGVNWFGRGGKSHPWSRCFPDFGRCSREEGISRYWDYYYEAAEGLQDEDFRVFPIEFLDQRDGVAEILEFAGVPQPELIAGVHEHKGHL